MKMMKMAYILFDGMTTLDFVGFYDAVTRMGVLKAIENVSWDFVPTRKKSRMIED